MTHHSLQHHVRAATDAGQTIGSLPGGAPYRRCEPVVRGPLLEWMAPIRREREQELVHMPDCNLVALHDAVGWQGVVINRDGDIVRESLLNRDDEKSFLAFSRTSQPDVIEGDISHFSDLPVIPGPHVYLPLMWDSNYGHWLVESLPRMAMVCDAIDIKKVKVVIQFHGQAMVKVCHDSLAYYGVTPDQIVQMTEGPQRFEQLLFPTPITCQPWSKAPLAIRALENLTNRVCPTSDGAERIFIHRPPTSRRQLLNQDEVCRFFTDKGFTKVEPAGMSLAQQIETFRNATHIVGVLGAECTNLIFSPRGVRLLGLAPYAMQDDFFWDLISHRKGSYACLHGMHQDEEGSMNSNFTIDMAQLDEICREFI